MPVSTMQDLLVQELQELYNGEKMTVTALPQIAQSASSPDLRNALEQHSQVTQQQVQRLEQAIRNLGATPDGKQANAVQGIISDAQQLIREGQPSAVLDAGIIGAAQKIEHLEIASYGTARTHAQVIGDQETANLLEQTLNEEKRSDQMLNDLAEQWVNEQAAQQSVRR